MYMISWAAFSPLTTFDRPFARKLHSWWTICELIPQQKHGKLASTNNPVRLLKIRIFLWRDHKNGKTQENIGRHNVIYFPKSPMEQTIQYGFLRSMDVQFFVQKIIWKYDFKSYKFLVRALRSQENKEQSCSNLISLQKFPSINVNKHTTSFSALSPMHMHVSFPTQEMQTKSVHKWSRLKICRGKFWLKLLIVISCNASQFPYYRA